MDRKPDGEEPAVHRCLLSDSEMSVFDLESQRLGSDLYVIDTSSDTDSSIYNCSLDESFQQIKDDLEQLHYASPRKPCSFRPAATAHCCGEPSSVAVNDDELLSIDINKRFDVMKNRVRSYRSKETETLRQYIIELNNTLTRITNDEGKHV